MADLIESRHIAARQLEKVVDSMERGVRIRRLSMARTPIQNIPCALDRIPFESYDYTKVGVFVIIIVIIIMTLT